MKKGVRRLCIVSGAIVAFLAALVLALELVLNSSWVRGKIDAAAAAAIPEGSLSYSRLHFSTIKSFPRLSVNIDSLSVTYPHSLYSEFDRVGLRRPMLSEGRGSDADTLVSATRIWAAVNIWRVFGGKISLSSLSIDRPRVFYHSYTADAANTGIFGPSAPKDTVSKPVSLPWICVGSAKVREHPYFIYTSQADTVYARLSFDELSMKGRLRLKKDWQASLVKGLQLRLDTLRVGGRLPADTLSLALDRFSIDNPRTNLLDIGLEGDALLSSSSLGKLHIPAVLQARAGFGKASESFDLKLHSMDAELAYVPLHAEGEYRMFKDYSYVDATASIDDCNLGEAFDRYARNFFADAADIRTDAHLNLGVKAEGKISEDEWPAVEAELSVPGGHVRYLPRKLSALLDVRASAKLTSDRKLSAVVDHLNLTSDGVSLHLDGDGRNLLGSDPLVAARADAHTLLDSLYKYMPEALDISGKGRLDLTADVNAYLREFYDYQFGRSHLNASLTGEDVHLAMPSQNLQALLLAPTVNISNGSASMLVDMSADSLAVQSSDSLRAHMRALTAKANVYKREIDGNYVPYVSLNTTEDKIHVRAGENRFGLTGTDVSIEAWKRVRKDVPRTNTRRHRLDSLRRIYPGASRDSLMSLIGVKSALDEFASKDIRVALDSSLLGLYSRWHPGGVISVDRAWLRSPALPLRTRLGAVDIALDDDDAQIASLDLNCGTSDVSLNGYAGNIRSFIRGRGPLRFDLGLHSGRLNLNEILVAMQKASEAGPVSTEYEDYVRDDLADATFVPDSTMRAFVVPKNLEGSVRMSADRVEYSDFDIRPASAEVNIRDRVLQLKDVDVNTNLGKVKLDAFYASHKKSDISAGLDLHLSEMSAYDIIHTLPTVNAMMPALKSFEGKLACDVTLTSQLDTNMNILTPTMNGLVRVTGENLHISNAGSLRKITRLLMFKDKNIGDIDDLYVDAVIEDNKVEIYPFELSVDRYKVALMGTQGFNGSMKYNISVLKSFIPFRFGINIYGNLDKWRFSLGRNKYHNGKVPSFTADLDTMQVNLLDVIRNIYDRGVDNAMAQAGREQRRLANARMLGGYAGDDSDFLSNEEFREVDAALYDMQMSEEMSDMELEISSAADDALDELTRQQMEWAAEHPWAEMAESRAQKRRAAKEAGK